MATIEVNWSVMEAARAVKAMSPRPAPELAVGDKVRVRLVSGGAGERKAHNFTGRVKALTIGERGGMALVTSEGNTAGEWFGISARLCQVEKFYQ